RWPLSADGASPAPTALFIGFLVLFVFGCLSLFRRLRLLGRGRLDRFRRLDHRFTELTLADYRQDARDVLADLVNLARVLELADRQLEAELVELPPGQLQPVGELVALQRPHVLQHLVGLHCVPPASRGSAPWRVGSARP